MTDTPTMVLRAKPTEVWFAALNDRGEQIPGTRDVHYLVFNMNVLADLEERFGSITGWSQAMGWPEPNEDGEIPEGYKGNPDAKVYQATRDTLAIALGRPARDVGAVMLGGELQSYLTAIGVAFAIANGADPKEIEENWRAEVLATTPPSDDELESPATAVASPRGASPQGSTAASSTSPSPTG